MIDFLFLTYCFTFQAQWRRHAFSSPPRLDQRSDSEYDGGGGGANRHKRVLCFFSWMFTGKC